MPIVIATLFIPMAAQARAAEPQPRMTGIFSDLAFNEEGGDLLGTEVFILPTSGDNSVAFVQTWQGGTTPPVVVPVTIKDDAVTFSVPAPSLGEGTYRGRITAGGLDGIWQHPLASGGFAEEPLHLPRKNSYWQ